MIKGLRIISFLEGLSYLYLLYCSIYLKRMMGDEHAIDTPGAIHGGLFVLFCLFLMLCWRKYKWSIKHCAMIFIASIIPFGFIWIDQKLKKA